MPRLLTSIAAALVLSAALEQVATVSAQDTAASIIYVTAADSQDRPIGGLGVDDFIIKEDGKERQILSVERAEIQPQISVLVDDNGTGVFGFGLVRLAERLQGNAEMSFRTVINQVQLIADFSPDVNVWMAALGRLGVRPGTPEGGQLLEGIFETARDFTRRESRRPVILALTVGGDEQSPRLATQVLNELWKSHAALHVVFVNSPAVRPQRAASRPSDLLEGGFNLGRVLGDGPKETGGRRREVLATGAVLNDVQRVASDLRDQYVIAYARPAAGNPLRLQVTSKRRGVTVIAPTRAPAR
jgi:hypothetical protein